MSSLGKSLAQLGVAAAASSAAALRAYQDVGDRRTSQRSVVGVDPVVCNSLRLRFGDAANRVIAAAPYADYRDFHEIAIDAHIFVLPV